MAGFKSQRTLDLEAEVEQARRMMAAEGERSPDGSDAYTLAAQTVQDLFEALHHSYADDRDIIPRKD